ncbi:MAG TPA: hypothetical protein DEP69_05185, partial [Acidimicrobiaceae bacterium]|nr:hypothetical protein [Acidimicrobiaceae bacterium]
MGDFFDPLFDGLAWVLAVSYDLVDGLIGSNAYAVAIVMLTMAIMVVFTPLTIKGTRSMMQMSQLQPEIKRLQAKHRGDRRALNEEMMQLYQANKVNPLGGCLPMLVQIPVFFVLYRVINGLTNMETEGWPRNLSESSQMYRDLRADNGEMRSLGMDLAKSANEVLRDNFVESLPYLALVLVTFGLAWFQQRQMRSRRGGATQPNKQMEIMMKVMPFMLPVFSFLVPAALAVYFVTSSLYRIGQQAFIHRTMKPPTGASLIDVEPVESKTKPSDDDGRSGTGHRTPREIDPPKVSNERSKKALDADARRLADRAERSAQRKAAGSAGGIGSARRPQQGSRPAGGESANSTAGKSDGSLGDGDSDSDSAVGDSDSAAADSADDSPGGESSGGNSTSGRRRFF